VYPAAQYPGPNSAKKNGQEDQAERTYQGDGNQDRAYPPGEDSRELFHDPLNYLAPPRDQDALFDDNDDDYDADYDTESEEDEEQEEDEEEEF
jgi:hypothetical protein